MSGGAPAPREPLPGESGRRFLGALVDWRVGNFLFDDEARIGRRAFWIYVAGVMALAFSVFFSRTLRQTPAVHIVFGVALLYPSYCVFAKRLQDIGIAGGWAAVITLISAIDVVLAASGLKARPGRFATAVGRWETVGLVNVAFCFVVLGLWPGTSGANRHGLRQPPW